ncbi:MULTISPECIES: YbhB/YbcL family Raf kinase inhibitor-like protein [Atlantibacter]|uniref:YbhB/YbcL family Raf kinase inhibitor-like protein n=2 Tax=Enterobacteriaceae TaxID=543 RepID=H5V507_ATLHE|nr:MULTISPECIES: YbhB/YbcL family Raf kinase inhibitor-like protein [Atlantibacter]MCQ4969472.1 YbhB/YbcL family Raf kinase inhibitor-like protein [Enterobacteriaceae bacterium DFI.7.85]MBW9432046.1 YbhB/YbcL family Raf kinase inhibitor-like protein [Atlantibacter hermannii]MDQ7883529.1 YbhB/YbcL family Raf kinase inhibitor-like protein [Atlantibacter hermannii]MDU7391751.1 YbhB/YbcL family Raf kinase inhibitor-like protein [Atlantibacter hermannii]MDU7813857.1 YbhB/YbcL family Raf kinase inhi
MNKSLFSALCLLAGLSLPVAQADTLFILQSPDFADNAMMQKKFAGNAKDNPNCTGENASPALVWSHPPSGTKSFALVMHDPEGAKGQGVTHLVAYNIPSSTTGFAANALTKEEGFTGGKNTPGTTTWYGPCPPPGTGAHHYTFTLIATDLAPELKAGMTREELLAQLKGHALAATGLIGRFGQ